ncbi:hypothetical protein PIB30_085481 [Stylosanthes scabra]|uniref:Uncharacterized protein n=1 Tax=Stylosanthes scabra TaxID=79078 RepID=A0ABU6WSQ9_9FABA|nr:hypothetical protein [Stylosanthes scabra]
MKVHGFFQFLHEAVTPIKEYAKGRLQFDTFFVGSMADMVTADGVSFGFDVNTLVLHQLSQLQSQLNRNTVSSLSDPSRVFFLHPGKNVGVPFVTLKIMVTATNADNFTNRDGGGKNPSRERGDRAEVMATLVEEAMPRFVLFTTREVTC